MDGLNVCLRRRRWSRNFVSLSGVATAFFFEGLIPSLKLPEAGQRPAPKDTPYLLRSRTRQSGFGNDKNKKSEFKVLCEQNFKFQYWSRADALAQMGVIGGRRAAFPLKITCRRHDLGNLNQKLNIRFD